MWIVWSRDSEAVFPPDPDRYERPDAGKHAQHVAARDRSLQVAASRFQDEFDLFIERTRLDGNLADGCVGRADHGVSVPWNRKHDAAVGRVRDHDRVAARQERSIEHEVDALAGCNERDGIRVHEAAHVIALRPRSVDHDARRRAKLVPALRVSRDDAVDEAVSIAGQRRRRRVIQNQRALFDRGLRQVDQQPGIVELAVVVHDAATQTLGLDGRQARERVFLGEDLGLPESIAACQHVVHLEADAVERRFPPFVVRDDECEVCHQVRRVLTKEAAFLERLHHQRNGALLEIPHAAVHELRGTAGRALPEVVLLDEQHLVAA